MFSIEEYASIRLKSVWTTSSDAAISNVRSPTTSSPVRRNPVPSVRSTTDLTRSRHANATESSTPLINAETGAGAWLWASASQVWNGTSPALAPLSPMAFQPWISST